MSGASNATEPVSRLAAFLYKIARDELSFGKIEAAIREAESCELGGNRVEGQELANLTRSWARRLTGDA